MSRTDLDAHTLARSLRRMAGDGSVEWVMEPIQADVLRDIADMLDDEKPTQSVAHGDLLAECDWHDSTLFLVLPEDPERIGVRLFPSRHAPSRMYVPMAETAQLKIKNAKMRELVLDMMRFFEDGDWCTTCEQACKCESQEQYEEDCLMRDVFHHRMRELGVEVKK